MHSWLERTRALQTLEARQLFFIGGAPRSGTTWLQQLLDSHPDVACRGEALFPSQFAAPLERMMQQRATAITDKNSRLFRHTAGFPLPQTEDTEFLVGTAVLLALHQVDGGRQCRAIGEKTPENVFFYPRLKTLFPYAKFVGIVRDPRDVLTSAWHFFHPTVQLEEEAAAKLRFVEQALPSLEAGMREMLALREREPDAAMVLSYEDLSAEPSVVAGRVFQFIGVRSDPATCSRSIEQAMFAVPADDPEVRPNRRFLRKGVVGDWRSTLPPEVEELIMRSLGWSFPIFGWRR